MIVIADTGPLNYLIRIDQIEVLPQLYTCVVIPTAVCKELENPNSPAVVRDWITHPPGWLEIRIPALEPDAELAPANLDVG